jgi:hypothetical protein
MCSPVDPGHYFALTYACAKARSRRLKAMFQVGVDWTESSLGYEYDPARHPSFAEQILRFSGLDKGNRCAISQAS